MGIHEKIEEIESESCRTRSVEMSRPLMMQRRCRGVSGPRVWEMTDVTDLHSSEEVSLPSRLMTNTRRSPLLSLVRLFSATLASTASSRNG